MSDERWYGDNYDSNLSTKEIAKKVRVWLKTIIPKDIKLSVRMQSFSMGSSIYVYIKEGFIYNLYIEKIDGDLRYTKAAMLLQDTIKGYMDSYNHDGSDSMTDYFDVKFYGHVSYDYDYYGDEKAKKLPMWRDSENIEIEEYNELYDILFEK